MATMRRNRSSGMGSEFILEVLAEVPHMREAAERRGLVQPTHRNHDESYDDHASLEDTSLEDASPEDHESLEEGSLEGEAHQAARQAHHARQDAEEARHEAALTATASARQGREDHMVSLPTTAAELARLVVLADLLMKPPPGLADD